MALYLIFFPPKIPCRINSWHLHIFSNFPDGSQNSLTLKKIDLPDFSLMFGNPEWLCGKAASDRCTGHHNVTEILLNTALTPYNQYNMFSTLWKTNVTFWITFNLLSANAVDLDNAEILLSGKGTLQDNNCYGDQCGSRSGFVFTNHSLERSLSYSPDFSIFRGIWM